MGRRPARDIIATHVEANEALPYFSISISNFRESYVGQLFYAVVGYYWHALKLSIRKYTVYTTTKAYVAVNNGELITDSSLAN